MSPWSRLWLILSRARCLDFCSSETMPSAQALEAETRRRSRPAFWSSMSGMVRPGLPMVTLTRLIGAGAVVTGVGLAGTAALSGATIVSGITTGGAAAGAMTAVGGLVVLGPVLAVNGIVRSVNNNEVNEQIELRQTKLPAALAVGEELLLNVFFPITPSPRSVEILYSDANGENSLIVETSSALDGLHLETPAE